MTIEINLPTKFHENFLMLSSHNNRLLTWDRENIHNPVI